MIAALAPSLANALAAIAGCLIGFGLLWYRRRRQRRALDVEAARQPPLVAPARPPSARRDDHHPFTVDPEVWSIPRREEE